MVRKVERQLAIIFTEVDTGDGLFRPPPRNIKDRVTSRNFGKFSHVQRQVPCQARCFLIWRQRSETRTPSKKHQMENFASEDHGLVFSDLELIITDRRDSGKEFHGHSRISLKSSIHPIC